MVDATLSYLVTLFYHLNVNRADMFLRAGPSAHFRFRESFLVALLVNCQNAQITIKLKVLLNYNGSALRPFIIV